MNAMSFGSRRCKTPARSLPVSLLLATIISSSLLTSTLAQGLYLTPSRPDGIALLPPPPLPGSSEEAADLASVQAVFKGRTPAEEKRAMTDATLAFSLFTTAIGPEFQPEKLPKIFALLREVKKEMGAAIDTPKDYWKRRRPYLLDPELSLGKPEPSFSYPSGHSTRGTVYSQVLAEIFPDQREAILQIGRNIGWDRVLIGKHFPSDVFAGRVLGNAVVAELKRSPAFMHDLAEARSEAQTIHPVHSTRVEPATEAATAALSRERE